MFRSDQHLIVQGKKSTQTGSKMGNKINKANVRMAHITPVGGEENRCTGADLTDKEKVVRLEPAATGGKVGLPGGY